MSRVVSYWGLLPVGDRSAIAATAAALTFGTAFAGFVCEPFEVDKLAPAAGASGDNAGAAVAIGSGWAMVGAPNHDAGAMNAGAVFVYELIGGVWTPGQTLLGVPPVVNARFGSSVALAGDAMVVGAPGHGASGAAFVYRFDGASWALESTLTPDDGGSGDAFGASVSIDGGRALVGAWGHNNEVGAAYVFDFDGAVWSQSAKLTPGGGAIGDEFGISVSLSGDAALVGAWGDDELGTNAGAAYVFRRDPMMGVWTEEEKLTASDGAATDVYGYSVSLEGDRALVGAFGASVPGAVRAGVAYVHRFDDGMQSWVEEQKLVASDPMFFSWFGNSVSLSGDRALIGAEIDGMDVGAAYVFELAGAPGTWFERNKLTASDAQPLRLFGYSVALDDNMAIIGSVGDNVNGSGSGSAYVFDIDGEPATIVENPADESVGAGGTAMFSVVATDPAALTYRWRRDGTPLFDDGRISGAATDMLMISMVSEAMDAGAYDVVIDNGCTTVISAPAALTVTTSECIGDFNGDGRVNAQDLGILLSRWGVCPAPPQDCIADLTGSGAVGAQDLAQLLSRWGVCEN